MSKMSIDALQANIDNVARSYLWEVLFSNPIGSGDTDTYSLRCRSTSMPGRSFGSILVPFKQTAGVKFPGKNTYSHTWTCTFVEGEDRKIFESLRSWQQAVVHDKTGIGSTKIKTSVTLNLLNTDGTVAKRIKLIGTYVESVADVSLSYGDENEIIVSVTFSYDRWE
jgi:hypothetical protein